MERKLTKYKSRRQQKEGDTLIRSVTPDNVAGQPIVRHLTLLPSKIKAKFKPIDDFFSALNEQGYSYLCNKIRNKMGPYKVVIDLATDYQSTQIFSQIKESAIATIKEAGEKGMQLYIVLNDEDAERMLSKSVDAVLSKHTSNM
jgi:hypothetical protein